MVYRVKRRGTRWKEARKDRSVLSFAHKNITFGNSSQLLGLISLAVKFVSVMYTFILHGYFEENE